VTSVQVPDIMQRARRMARRLLAGSGSAAVTAYRIDPSAPAAFVAHAMRADGRILVAACPPEGTPLAIAPDGVAVDVRLDVTLDAAEPGVRITAATAHLLGSLTWIEGGQLDFYDQPAQVAVSLERAVSHFRNTL